MATPSDPCPWSGLLSPAERERGLLAPYAMHSADSAGRRYPEPEHPYRGSYQRDRDRILHSAAYRRLSGKTQVFTGEMGDYHRTRLTHTLEVASLARTIGRALRLNEDLIEALALLHDIGHPPFGHAGEDALNACLAAEGGFSHNRHALTLVEEIEHRHESFPGLNLTAEVLAGQASRAGLDPLGPGPLLETQVVDAADSITYDAHDTDDAVKLGLVRIEELLALPLIDRCFQTVRQRAGDLSGERLRKAIVHELIDVQVGNVLEASGEFLARCNWSDTSAPRQSAFRIGPDPALTAEKRQLEEFLYAHVYRHERLVAVRGHAQEKLRQLWATLVDNPCLMPADFQQRAQQHGLPRSAAEYVAGMTDRYCQQCYQEWVAG